MNSSFISFQNPYAQTGRYSTMAGGEEGGGKPPIGATNYISESGGDIASTMAMGEEGGDKLTTMAGGEEGGTSFMEGEGGCTGFGGEGGGDRVTTMAMGEEGGVPPAPKPPTTKAPLNTDVYLAHLRAADKDNNGMDKTELSTRITSIKEEINTLEAQLRGSIPPSSNEEKLIKQRIQNLKVGLAVNERMSQHFDKFNADGSNDGKISYEDVIATAGKDKNVRDISDKDLGVTTPVTNPKIKAEVENGLKLIAANKDKIGTKSDGTKTVDADFAREYFKQMQLDNGVADGNNNGSDFKISVINQELAATQAELNKPGNSQDQALNERFNNLMIQKDMLLAYKNADTDKNGATSYTELNNKITQDGGALNIGQPTNWGYNPPPFNPTKPPVTVVPGNQFPFPQDFMQMFQQFLKMFLGGGQFNY